MTTDHLILQNLKKTYGNKTAVNIASLSILPNTFTCIVGKSGCGKTTLLRLLAGLETPDTEEKTITGLPAKTAPVFQEPRLMPWLTVKENIIFSLKEQDGNLTKQQHGTPSVGKDIATTPLSPEERCTQLLKELELTDAASLYPKQLSGGMAQRVSLGRTLFYDPDLILMDEPFSALDYFTRRNLQDMVLRLFQYQKKTILFVTHDVEEALLLGDRILVMENGSIKVDMPVPLPFPRKAADSSLQDMRQRILDLLTE